MLKHNYTHSVFSKSTHEGPSRLQHRRYWRQTHNKLTERSKETIFRGVSSDQKSFMVTRKAKLFPKENQPPQEIEKEGTRDKMSNFQRLKEEIKHLETSQFLNLKSKPEVPESYESQEYLVNNKFQSSKKLSTFEKYKATMKQPKKDRQPTNLLSYGNSQNLQYSCIASLKLNNNSKLELSHNDIHLKKRCTPNIVKKYYRPKSCSHRSIQEMHLNRNEVRGRKLKSSVSNKEDRENTFLVCF